MSSRQVRRAWARANPYWREGRIVIRDRLGRPKAVLTASYQCAVKDATPLSSAMMRSIRAKNGVGRPIPKEPVHDQAEH